MAPIDPRMTQVTEFDRLMSQLANGSEDAAMQLAEKYTPYIIRTVRRGLTSQMRQKMDSQDVAQTLWASLLLRPTELSRLKSPAEFIAYLAQATRNKVAEKKRRLLAQKRDINRELQLEPHDDGTTVGDRRDRGLCSKDATPSTMASLRERWQATIQGASERDRQIMELRLRKYTFLEISTMLSIHEQTARRVVDRLVEQFAG
jgi:RNA polymerase sigma factor (sigma-70 family)